MKNLHKGEISINVLGTVSISAGAYPHINVNDVNIEETISEQLGIAPSDYNGVNFYGRVTVVVECLNEEPEIKNTMVDHPDPITAVPMSLEESVKVLSEIPNEN